MSKSWIWPILIFGGIIFAAKKAASNAKAQVSARVKAIDQVLDQGNVYTPEAVTQTAPAGYDLARPSGKIL